MKYVRMLLAVAVLIYPVTSAFASCPDRYDLSSTFFFFDTSCGSRSGDISTGTLSCNSSADQFDLGSGSVDYSMTVPSDLSSAPWGLHIYVDFSDSGSYSLNGISASVVVRHNGNVSYADGFFFHDGSQGSLSCQQIDSSSFTAYPGDTITVTYTGTKYTSGATMKISPPTIFWN